jgi:hypothetical protein
MRKFLALAALFSTAAFAANGTMVSVSSERTFAPRGFDDLKVPKSNK